MGKCMAEHKKYIVKEGDTLESLAKHFYNDSIFADSLRQVNRIAPRDNVRVEMQIKLPPRLAAIGPSEKVKDKTVKHILYGKLKSDSNYLFPLPKQYQDKGYHAGARSFGWNRGGGRCHAGCDLYAPLGKEIFAVADGIIQNYHFFYWKTFALEIDHGDFSVVYGEVQPPADPEKYGITVTPEVLKLIKSLDDFEKSGLPNSFKKGSPVKKGDHIAYVGQLYKDNGSVPFAQTMLHFEKYSNKATGPFTEKTNINNYLHVPVLPYKRRKDLQNPTEFLDSCELID
jgi:murein DD-endopeptidase MepM/ murein hydrolase activator NlpD